MTLANERTFLAWVRTMLAVLGGAVALNSLGVPASDAVRTTLVVALALFAGATMVLAWVRWSRVERAMRLGQPLPAFTLGLVVTVAVAATALVVAVAFIWLD